MKQYWMIWLWLIVVVCFCTFVLAKPQPKAETTPRPRFEKIYHESPNDGSDFYINDITIWHDRETGQELVCMNYSRNSGSCYLTGRKW